MGTTTAFEKVKAKTAHGCTGGSAFKVFPGASGGSVSTTRKIGQP